MREREVILMYKVNVSALTSPHCCRFLRCAPMVKLLQCCDLLAEAVQPLRVQAGTHGGHPLPVDVEVEPGHGGDAHLVEEGLELRVRAVDLDERHLTQVTLGDLLQFLWFTHVKRAKVSVRFASASEGSR